MSEPKSDSESIHLPYHLPYFVAMVRLHKISMVSDRIWHQIIWKLLKKAKTIAHVLNSLDSDMEIENNFIDVLPC